jgi:hypothetical protein
MKNKYVSYNDVYKDYSQYVDINDYLIQYRDDNLGEYKSETEDERVAREKAEKRNNKIDQILG